uniref:Metallophosphoesterase n=1 Tax=uncultured marine thaumarchaeote AD1000_33_G09 TaxID=1455909 RepID=A0A075FQ14_9ARCH|nr:metallophosphoesterase [uncultured marine thaumarchaeote AD1000_33_G09]
MNKIEGKFIEFDVTGKRAKQVNEEINKKLEEVDVDNKLVVIRIFWRITFWKYIRHRHYCNKKIINRKNAIAPQINRNKLSTKELRKIRISSEDKLEIEEELFRENIINIKPESRSLQNEKGIIIAKELLKY